METGGKGVEAVVGEGVLVSEWDADGELDGRIVIGGEGGRGGRGETYE